MKILLSISLLALSFPLTADSPAQEVTETTSTVEAEPVADLDVPASFEAPAEEAQDDQPRQVSKATHRVNKRQRSRHVLDVVLAGIVAVGTFIAILLLS